MIDAEVRPDLMSVVGTMYVDLPGGMRFVDAQDQLPMPTDDLTERRTFPNRPEAGRTHWWQTSQKTWRFYSVLPRRYGASGTVPGHGLFLNGLWHPQPVQNGQPSIVDWKVRLHLPANVVGVLNGHVGHGEIEWSGPADRLALALIPEGVVTWLDNGTGQTAFVSRRLPSAVLQERLAAVLRASLPSVPDGQVAIVSAPLRRRLVRPAPGMLFLSDRAFRLTGQLWRFHIPAVQGGIIAASLPNPSPWEREFVAAAVAPEIDAGTDLQSALGWLSWIPEIDSLLYDGTMPFYDDAFGDAWRPMELADDLQEVLGPETPAAVVARRLDIRYGDGTALRLAAGISEGLTLTEACMRAGIPPSVVDNWRARDTPHELSLEVTQASPEGVQITVHHDGDDDVPAQPIVIKIDGDDTVWEAPAGPASTQFVTTATPNRVAIDPDRTVPQADRSDDQWPRPMTWTAAFFPYEVNVASGWLSAAAAVSLRRKYSSDWQFHIGLRTDPEDLVGATFGATRYLGRLLNRRSRPLRISAGAGPSLLNPAFRPTERGSLAWGSYTAITWDSRDDQLFPRRGERARLASSVGWTPQAGVWTQHNVSAALWLPVMGRSVLASRASGGLATGSLQHRLLQLGGSNNVQGLAPDSALGTHRVAGRLEWRWQVVREASVPLPLMWLSHLQLQPAVDVGWLRTSDISCEGEATDCGLIAAGWSAGVLGTADVLGARPTSLGAWVAAPLYVSSTELKRRAAPAQAYLRLTQAF